MEDLSHRKIQYVTPAPRVTYKAMQTGDSGAGLPAIAKFLSFIRTCECPLGTEDRPSEQQAPHLRTLARLHPRSRSPSIFTQGAPLALRP